MNRVTAAIFSILSFGLAHCGSDQPEKAEPLPPLETATQTIEPEIVLETAVDTTQFEQKDGYIILSWTDLAIPDYRLEYSDEAESEVMIPVFSPLVQYLNGRRIMIKGYVFPFEESGEETYYVLSQYPFSQCFFCGAAGPESVMDLLPKNKFPRLKMDDNLAFRGRLRLNDSDFLYLNYMLEEAEAVR